MDVSHWQGNVAWQTWYSSGMRFAYVKATESTSYTNPYFAQQYNGSYNVGMIRGSYHFAVPSNCTGNSTAFHTINPLWLARYASAVGTLPGGWPYQTIWQYTSDGNMDKNWFNGALSGVQALARG
jgi:GH25 family lysozyme M1 (1,4-beta-N-acetylmuramidase)